MKVENIYCVGRNYQKHAAELGNDVPAKPMIFNKTTHSYVEANGQSLSMPKNRGSIHYEVELVFRLARSFEKGKDLKTCIDQMAVGVDFTLRDEQNELKKKGHPWTLAKGFPNAALISPFFEFNGIEQLLRSHFSLQINGNIVQFGNPNDMIFSLSTIFQFCHENLGLAEGDIVFTGTPEGVGEINVGDELKMFYNDEVKGTVRIG